MYFIKLNIKITNIKKTLKLLKLNMDPFRKINYAFSKPIF